MVTSMEAARAYVLAVQLRHRERVGTAGPYGGCGSWEGTRVANCPEGKGCKLLKWEAERQGSSPSVCVSTDRPTPSSQLCSGPARAGCSALLLRLGPPQLRQRRSRGLSALRLSPSVLAAV